MRKWKAQLREARVDKRAHGSKREREVSAEIDAVLGIWDPKSGRAMKWLPLDMIVLGDEPSTSSLIRRLGDATEAQTGPAEIQQHPSSSQDAQASQKSVSELEKLSVRSHEGCGRPAAVESCMLAHVASELLAIRRSSGKTSFSHDTDVDLIAASYLLRIATQPTDSGSSLTCARPIDSVRPSLLQRQTSQPPITSTLATAPQDLAYSLHKLSTNHDPEANYFAPYLRTVRHFLITIDLASVAHADPLTKQPNIFTLLELSKSVVQACKGNSSYERFDIFLAFLHVEHLEQQLQSAEQKLDPDSYIDFESYVHRPTPPTLKNATYSTIFQYLNSLFGDVKAHEIASLSTPPAAIPPPYPTNNINIDLPRLSPACRAALHYIQCRFYRIHNSFHNSFAIKVFPCLVDPSNNTSLRRLLTIINDVVISENVRVNCCFGTRGPSADDYGPAPGRLNF